MDEKEIRQFRLDSIEIRAADDKSSEITGYISVYNQASEDLGGFIEYVDARAFDKTLADGHNILALWNHDINKVLGSTQAGNFKLESDNKGLRFSLTPNTRVSYIGDLVELVRDGVVAFCSFGFAVREDRWLENRETGKIERTLLDVDLYEGTLTCSPAYTGTKASCRSLEKFMTEKQQAEAEGQKELENSLKLIEIELIM